MAGNLGTNKPSSRGLRDPISNNQNNMRIVNPPRFSVFGGFSNKSKAFFKNLFGITKPGDTR